MYCDQVIECWQTQPCYLHRKEVSKSYGRYAATWEVPLAEDVYKTVVHFVKDGEHIYSKVKNGYHTKKDKFMLLEWFELPAPTKEIVFIFNDEHGCISLFEAATGNLIHKSENNDMFLSGYQIFDEGTYLYAVGWFWNPLPMRVLFHIPTFLVTPNYEPIVIGTSDCNMHDIPPISLFGCSSCQEFLSKEDDIMKAEYQKLQCKNFNEHRKGDMLLKLLLVNEDKIEFKDVGAKQLLQDILGSNRSIFYTSSCSDNENHHYAERLLAVPWRPSNTTPCFNGTVVCTIGHGLHSLLEPELNSRFTLVTDLGNLCIVMKCKFDVDIDFEQRLTESGWSKEQIESQKCNRFIFNPEHPLTIAVSVVS